MKVILYCFTSAVLTICQAQVGAARWDIFEFGSYPIGFQVFDLEDKERVWKDSLYRPVQVTFWYPAMAGTGDLMKFKDYFLLGEQEIPRLEVLPDDTLVARYQRLAIKSGVTQEGIESVFASEMTAFKGAEQIGSGFPLLLVAQGNGHAIFNQVVLCEFLASHGFYVVSVPSPTRISGPFADYDQLVDKTKEQAADLALASKFVQGFLDMEAQKIGMVAYSFAGRSAITWLHEGRSLDALVSWDSGLANEWGKEWTDYLEGFDPGSIKVPLLHFYQQGDRSVKPDFDLIQSLGSLEKYRVEIPEVNHGFFMIRGAADAAIPGFQQQPYPNGTARYSQLLQLTLAFLEGHLKDKTSLLPHVGQLEKID